jgi:hypothetical protein
VSRKYSVCSGEGRGWLVGCDLWWTVRGSGSSEGSFISMGIREGFRETIECTSKEGIMVEWTLVCGYSRTLQQGTTGWFLIWGHTAFMSW